MIRVLCVLLLLAGSCGQEKVQVEKPVPVYPPGCDERGCTEPPDPEPEPDKISYQAMQGLLNQYCASCHANAPFMNNERALRNSTTYDRIFNRSMPPQSAEQIAATDRVKMLNWF
jgi:hypothetical protein